jgi:hypothetical protein
VTVAISEGVTDGFDSLVRTSVHRASSPSSRAACGESRERHTGLHQHRNLARHTFIAADDDVDKERIKFDASVDTAGLFGGDQGRAGAQEGVQHGVAAISQGLGGRL